MHILALIKKSMHASTIPACLKNCIGDLECTEGTNDYCQRSAGLQTLKYHLFSEKLNALTTKCTISQGVLSIAFGERNNTVVTQKSDLFFVLLLKQRLHELESEKHDSSVACIHLTYC